MKSVFSTFRLFAAALLLFTASAFAAPVDGTWTGTMATPNGDFQQIFKLKADGATLAGTMAGPDGTDIKIANGKVDGDTVSFSVTLNFNGNEIVLNYKGVIKEDQIAFDIDVMGNSLAVTVKKSAA